MISKEPLWWPPNRLCGRYLAPYLSGQVGFASDVMTEGDDALEVISEPPAAQRDVRVLRDLPRIGKELRASRANEDMTPGQSFGAEAS